MSIAKDILVCKLDLVGPLAEVFVSCLFQLVSSSGFRRNSISTLYVFYIGTKFVFGTSKCSHILTRGAFGGTLSCNWFEYFCTGQPGNRNQHSVRHLFFGIFLPKSTIDVDLQQTGLE